MPQGIRSYGPGKFDTILDSWVWEASLDGTDDEVGSVDENGVWYGMLSGLDGVLDGCKPTDEEQAFVRAHAGAIVSENSQGFVTVEYYETASELSLVWERINAEFQRDVETAED